MIRKHPARVLGLTALVAVAFLALSYPGRDKTSGPLYFISAVGWFGFLISVLTLVVLAGVAAFSRGRARRA